MSIGAQPVAICTATLVSDRSRITGELALSLADAAAKAGFGAVSLRNFHHDRAVADGVASEAFLDHHRELGLGIDTIEMLTEWATTDLTKIASTAAPTLDLAKRAGASNVVAIPIFAELPPMEVVTAGLGLLCDKAADRGVDVSLEFLPWSGMPDIPTVARIIEATDRDNLGMVVDLWHWFRAPTGADLDALRSFPAERIHTLQLDDAPAAHPADPITETMTARLLPGQGDIDTAAVLAVLDEIGARPLVAAEVFSTSLQELGPEAMAAEVHAASTKVLSSWS